jgi:bifunctional non-homologous end joining protein LigD
LTVAARADLRQIADHCVEISHPEKVLFPEDGVTNQELVDYYQRIAPWILPHLRDRPLAMGCYPDGIDRPGFLRKDVPSHFPAWIRTVTIRKKAGGTVRHVVCDDTASLVYLANQACITPHTWLSRTDKLEFPDQMAFDLDPSGDEFGAVKAIARSLEELLGRLGLPRYLKTTGSRGLHVAVPVRRSERFDSVRAFARTLAEIVVNQEPGQRTLEQRKSRRGGRVFVDINRNGYAQTVAPAYAVRARTGAPISVPLRWDELEDEDLRPDGVTIRTAFDRLEKVGDPWADFWQQAASLGRAQRKLEKAHVAKGISQEAEAR